MSKQSQGVALMLGGATANQMGAATAALAFPVLGPAGVVAVRQWVAAVVLFAIGRPRVRDFTARQWRPVLGLAAVYATMNLTLYSAIDRIGLGLAVTLEFLGPLAIALAGSRRRRDLVCALTAAAAVGVLTRPRPSTDYGGIGLALAAAACWAGYILLNRTIGRRLPGARGSAAAAAVSGLAYVPVGVVVFVHHHPTLASLGAALTTGVLSSAVPLLADLLALRRVPARFFGVFMSVNPVLAALVGLVVLGQHLDSPAWTAIVVIVAANATACRVKGAEAGPVPSEPEEVASGSDVGPGVAVDGHPERCARTRAGDRCPVPAHGLGHGAADSRRA
ncbi:DMT family transporter [Amycolatopsis sp. FDAARGOS 1241]|uniref:EamA family transporter n=1 Tax=Amycolatopsis sp. FDAARGOS 1241 TaxID=2778070 RepID=UPI001EF3AE6B|nr:EamA family transporter [Amycolatopsis sp. FDAARGOS 1241]